MKANNFLSLFLVFFSVAAFSQNVWLNEIHYDNVGTDQGEFLEIALQNPGNYNLADFAVTLYNGNNGGLYDTKTLDQFTAGISSEGITLYYLVFPENGIQNGEEDGLAISYQGTVVPGQFLSWEGTLVAADGPAAGMTSADIGVAEGSTTQPGQSLQLAGSGTQYGEFTWQEAAAATMGALNNDQTFGAFTPDPEPSNYPTEFTALAEGFGITLTWTDATGNQLPHAYLILASDENAIDPPQDGTPVANDPDLADGSAALNIAYGQQTCSFGNLVSSTAYYFKIFPYTNANEFIDYKTDGIPPEATATTSNLTVIHQEDFEDQTLGEWTAVSVTGQQVWATASFSNDWFAKISGWEGQSNENDDWLISPPLNLENYHDEILTFITAMNYTGPLLQVKISTDYAGAGDPYQAEWEILETVLSPGNWEWTPSGEIDISSFNSEAVHIAFQYTSTSSESQTWEVDDIMVIGEGNVGVNDPANPMQLEVYPNPSEGFVQVKLPRGAYDMYVYSSQGIPVHRTGCQGGLIPVDLLKLPHGLYLLEVVERESGDRATSKIIIE
jgi:hypothetical protein